MRQLSFKGLAVAIIGTILFLGGYSLSIADRQYEIDEVTEQNDKVFHAMQRAFEQSVKNSDIIVRYSHYTDLHTDPVPFCPECFNSPDGHDDMEMNASPEEIKSSIKQLLLDSIEFEESFKRMSSSLFNQRHTLQHTLNQLREQNK
jgi:hypothetical protein